jgi:ATP-dependent DNA ligase
LLFLNGKDLRDRPLVERRKLLAKLLEKAPEGRRSSAWLKIKLTRQQEFVIGGYTPPQGGRQYFGALLVGVNSPGGLLFAGRAGTGISEKALETLYGGLQNIIRPTCPFVNLPLESRGRWGLGITLAVMKRCRWARTDSGLSVRANYILGSLQLDTGNQF